MKKLLLWNLLAILFFGSAIAQGIVTTRPQKRAIVLEEYTGINCPACPYGHAQAQAIADANEGKVFIVNVHTGGYATPNAGQPDYRTPYGDDLAGQTSLGGYPSATINRHLFTDLTEDGGTALYRYNWEEASERIMSEASNVNVGVSTVYNPETREVAITVEAYYVEGLPFGVNSNFLNVVLLESNIIGYQNGASSSYSHNHMLRDMITGQWGEEITEIEQGVLVSRTYYYTIDEEYVAENCSILAFITETRQEVITGAETPVINGWNNGEIASDYGRIFTDNSLESGVVDEESVFDVTIINGLEEEQIFALNLTHDAPVDWDVYFTIDGSNFDQSTSVTLSADEIKNITINVTPGETPAVTHALLTLTSETYPNENEKVEEVFIISGVDNLIVNGSGQNNEIYSEAFSAVYKTGLSEAGCQSFGAIPGSSFTQAADFGILDNVKNIYLNIGGTRPVLSVEHATLLTDFVDNGGNLLIAGQDVGSDIFGAGASSGNLQQKLFFQNYLSVSFIDDGDNQNNSVSSTVDSIYSGISGASLFNAYSGSFDPDAIKKYGNAQEILYYPNGKAAAVKNYKGTSKIVYFAFGLEQLQNEEDRNDLLNRSYQWFEGWEGSNVDLNNNLEINMYPNPVDDIIIIETQDEFEFVIRNITGQVVMQGRSEKQIVISDLPAGLFLLELRTMQGLASTKFVKRY